MFIMINDQVSVENLLRGIIVASGNDACVALAEGIAGSSSNKTSLEWKSTKIAVLAWRFGLANKFAVKFKNKNKKNKNLFINKNI